MKKNFNSKDGKKTNNPLTAFGELLKNAVSKPISESKIVDNKVEDQTIPQVQKAKPSVSNPQNQTKSGLTYKIGDKLPSNEKTPPSNAQTVQSNQLKPKLPPAQTSPSRPFPQVTPALPKEAKSVSQNSPVPVSRQPESTPIITKPAAPHTEGKYARFMRQKFWQNLKGESLSGHQGRPLRINLGIDLGTSFSKVVYRLGEESFPVLFGENKNKLDDYLMPSVIAIGNKGIKCRFELEEEKLKKAALIPNFKICLTCERGDKPSDCSITKCNLSNLRSNHLPKEVVGEEATFLNVFYLAKLIARTKQAVRRQLPEREIPSDITIRWSANLAVPDKFIDSKVSAGFGETLEIAWLMSEVFIKNPNALNKAEAVDCYIEAKLLHDAIKNELSPQNEGFDCFTYSEIGAEVASVTRSPTSEEGLYVLVDVGAGTVDTSVFRFRRIDGESVQETYAANIFKLGAAQIDARANSSFARKSLNFLRQLKENVFGQNAQEALLHITQEIKTAESEVNAELREMLIAVYREAFSKQNNIEDWTDLKLLMGGGGSKIESYTETARYAFSPKFPNSRQIATSVLSVPRDFHMNTLPANQFHRFAVAYGLSFELIHLPELIASDKVLPMKNLRQRIYLDPTDDG